MPLLDEYSIWLEPAGGGFLSEVITHLAQEHGTVSFDPHVTVLGGIGGDESEIISKFNRLARQAERFPVTLDPLTVGTHFYKRLFFPCQWSGPLNDLHAQARDLFGEHICMPGEPYSPHISIVYGDEPIEAPQELQERYSRYNGTFLMLWTLSLWHARGAANEWRKVAYERLLPKQ